MSYFAFCQKLKRAITRLKPTGKHYVVVPIKGGVKRVEVSDIYYIESQGHNLVYHTKDGIFLSAGTMKSAEDALREMHFSRGNKGYLINLEHVEGIKDKCAVVKGENLILSRPRINVFMQELTKY